MQTLRALTLGTGRRADSLRPGRCKVCDGDSISLPGKTSHNLQCPAEETGQRQAKAWDSDAYDGGGERKRERENGGRA